MEGRDERMKSLLEQTIVIIKEAGEKLRDSHAQVIQEKGDVANLVTDMDCKIQDFLVASLKKIRPDSHFLVEEEEQHLVHDDYLWIIDPIDGTTNYAYDYRHSAISIAFLHRKEVIMGVVYNPYTDELFHSIKGEGAFLNGQPIHVQDRPMESSLILCGTSPYHKHMVDTSFEILKTLFVRGRDLRRSGSAVLDLCYVACGRVDAFFEYRLSPWDFAAASLLIQEAGGLIECPNGVWGFEKAITIIAGNPNNIKELRAIVQEHTKA